MIRDCVFLIFFSQIGFFSAALYGQETSGNLLENEWLGGGIPQGLLNLFMSIYLALRYGCRRVLCVSFRLRLLHCLFLLLLLLLFNPNF